VDAEAGIVSLSILLRVSRSAPHNKLDIGRFRAWARPTG
jgi:hypothetical protein